MRLDKSKLRKLADALMLDPRPGETTEQLYARCLTRAGHMGDLINTEESGDPDRTDWPWTEED